MAFASISFYNHYHVKRTKQLSDKINIGHYVIGYIFLFYLVVTLRELIGFPTISQWGREFSSKGTFIYPTIDFLLFDSGIQTSDIINGLLFVPFGFFLPVLWQKYDWLLLTIECTLSAAVVVEIGQLFMAEGMTDVSDVLTSVVGGIIGWGCYRLFRSAIHRVLVPEPGYTFSRFLAAEPYVYLLIAAISVVLS